MTALSLDPLSHSDSARHVPCVYCREPIPAVAFQYWSNARRLLSGTCPACEQRTTLTAATWRRWSGPAPLDTA